MSTLVKDVHAIDLKIGQDSFAVYFADERSLTVPMSYFPRLMKASPEQRTKFVISGGGTGIHWDEIDEDISVSGLLLGIGDRTV
ncbi:MAG: DUF2442 domain-containing protein [Spirochaetes bacterium]|nr:MAG: DUF2442 domain-containing protein [Spirochaetota bacterium]